MKKINYNRTLEDKIDRYVSGQLNTEEIDQLWGEVINDSYYYEYMVTAANVKKLNAKNKEARIHNIGKSKRVKFYWLAAAASIAILIGVLSVVLRTNVTSTNPLKPLSELALQNVRSVEVLNNSPQSQLKRGINLANNGKVNQALSLLQKISNSNSKKSIKASAEMNIGIINYNHKNYNEALKAFNKVVSLSKDNVLMKEKGYWYEGNSYLQLGKIEKARISIQNAYNLNGAYRRIAGRYLKQINSELAKKKK